MKKIVTWNVNSIAARLERVLDFLKRETPDILCLQELKGMEEKFPFKEMEEAGYHAAVHGQKTYNGVAILSREIPSNVMKGFSKGKDPQARFISAQFDSYTIMSAYIPNGQEVGCEKYDYKLAWLKDLRKHLADNHKKDENLLLMGDFNVIPEDRDVHDPEAWEGGILFSEPEKEALRNVLDFGLIDTFRLHHPEDKLYSWWDYRALCFPKNMGARIDFILATAPLAAQCTDAQISRADRKGPKPSDHAPVIATFKL